MSLNFMSAWQFAEKAGESPACQWKDSRERERLVIGAETEPFHYLYTFCSPAGCALSL